jgi:hypothetical protein
LDGSDHGERWSLPIHLIDAIFYAEEGQLHVFESSSVALSILGRLRDVIKQGFEQRSLQRLPHITLLDLDFYAAKMKPVLADWAFLWLQKNHLHGVVRDVAGSRWLVRLAWLADWLMCRLMLLAGLWAFRVDPTLPRHPTLSLHHPTKRRPIIPRSHRARLPRHTPPHHTTPDHSATHTPPHHTLPRLLCAHRTAPRR